MLLLLLLLLLELCFLFDATRAAFVDITIAAAPAPVEPPLFILIDCARMLFTVCVGNCKFDKEEDGDDGIERTG